MPGNKVSDLALKEYIEEVTTTWKLQWWSTVELKLPLQEAGLIPAQETKHHMLQLDLAQPN